MYWRMLTCPTADFGCKRCIRWLHVSAFDWDQYHPSWLTGIHVPDTHIFLGELEQSTVCTVDYIVLKAKWKIFCTLCTKRHVLSLYFEIPVADSVDWRNYHRISRNHSFVARIYFFNLFCCLSKDCQELGASDLDFSLKLREVALCRSCWILSETLQLAW